MRPNRLHAALRAAAVEAGLPGISEWAKPWYQATRHTYASHYVLAGGSLESLAALLGHSSTEVTKRYAHLRPDALARADVDRIAVDLTGRGTVVALKDGQQMASPNRHAEPATIRKRKRA